MAEHPEIKTGDTVQVIVTVWREDELPNITNFYTGRIVEVVERAKHSVYVRLENLDRLIPTFVFIISIC